jgi:predicted TIM-barrel fold metal-dependent hydrolase
VAEATADYDMIPGVGFMVDTAICAIRLIMSGLLEEHPELIFVLPHTGGALPYLIGRIDDQVQRLGRGGEKLKELPSAYLKRMYTDTVAPDPRNLAFALDFWGPDKILFATDHPFTNIQPYVDLVQSADISQADKDKIFGGNARHLFRL